MTSRKRNGNSIPRTVAFVILTWNSEKYVRCCIESVLGLGELCVSVYVVDNGSTDSTIEILKTLAADDNRVHVLPQEKNLGTTVSRNIAFREILTMSNQPGYVCVLDSDTVSNRLAFESVLEALEADSTIGVAGPSLLGSDGLIQKSGRNLPTLKIKLFKAFPCRGLQERAEKLETSLAPVVNGVQNVGYLLSACWVMPTSSLWKVGLLDEAIFYAPEDVDWCVRCHGAGLRVVRVHGPAITHYYQRLSKRKLLSKMNVEHIKGLVYYFAKHRYLFDSSRASGSNH